MELGIDGQVHNLHSWKCQGKRLALHIFSFTRNRLFPKTVMKVTFYLVVVAFLCYRGDFVFAVFNLGFGFFVMFYLFVCFLRLHSPAQLRTYILPQPPE